MPFKSTAQMRAAFGGYLGPEMKARARTWAHETPNIKDLPAHVSSPRVSKPRLPRLNLKGPRLRKPSLGASLNLRALR